MTLPAPTSYRAKRPAPSGPFRHVAVGKLRAAGVGFLGRWKRTRDSSETQLRHIEAIVALLLCGVVLIVALTSDATIARAVLPMPISVIGIFDAITKLGLSGYIFALSALVAVGALLARGAGLGRRADAALAMLAGRATFVIAVNAVGGIASQVLKHLFGRARPKLIDMVGPFHFDAFALKATFASFPSGHTITAFATCLALGYFIPRLRWPLLLLACLVGVSRVVISAHYASDVVAGAAIGFGTTYLLRRAFARRGLVFKRSPRGLVPRGEGMVLPALTALISTRASHRA